MWKESGMFETMQQYSKTEWMKHKWAATNGQQTATLKCVAAKGFEFFCYVIETDKTHWNQCIFRVYSLVSPQS